VIHNLGRQRSFVDKLIGKKILFACEIVSSQNQGIRYLIRTSPEQVNNLKRSLISYLPFVEVKTVNEYLPKSGVNYHTKIVEYELAKHFAHPLQKQNTLEEHDPVAYITGMMTKLLPGELVSFQIVLSPTNKRETSTIKHKIIRGEDVIGYLNQLNSSFIASLFLLPLKIIQFLLITVGYTLRTVFNDFADAKASYRQSQGQYLAYSVNQNLQRPARVLTNFEQDIVKAIGEKIDQPLFEAKIRILVSVKEKQDQLERIRGFNSSLGVFSATNNQSLKKKFSLLQQSLKFEFQKRLLSLLNSSPTTLSVSEVSDLYHFPFTKVTQTENISKNHSKELPAPLSQR
jgi:hypothetical protein